MDAFRSHIAVERGLACWGRMYLEPAAGATALIGAWLGRAVGAGLHRGVRVLAVVVQWWLTRRA